MAGDKEVSQKQVDKVLAEEKKKVSSLMLDLSPELQAKLVDRICADVSSDEAARKGYMDKRQQILDAYEGVKSPKSDPFVGCANVKTMITAMVVELLHAKLFPSIYNEDLSYWVPQEKSDIQNAEDVSKFMKWAQRSMDFGQFVDDWTKARVLEGTVVTKIRWDVKFRWIQRKIPRQSSKIKALKNVILNLFGKATSKKIEPQEYDVTYEYKKFETCKVELIPLEDVGFPVFSIPGCDENELRHIWHRTKPFLDELKAKEDQGYFINTSKIGEDVERVLLQGTEKVKIDAEGSKQVDTDKADYPLEQIEWYGKYNIPAMGYIECIVWIEKKTKTFLGAMPLVNMSRINQRPFVIDQMIRRTGRMYGKTVAEMVMELEDEMNSIHNQRLDAGTMSIIPPGIYRAASGMTPEEIRIKPGLWIPMDDVNDAKYMVMPNNVLVSFQEEKMLMELIEKISSAGSYQSGQESGVNRSRSTARGTMALIAQGEQRFMVLAKRAQFGLSKILTKVLQEYQQNIPPGLEQRILGDTGDPIFPDGLSPEDIAGNFDNFLTLNSTGGSKSLELQKWSQIYQGFIQNPLVMSNPAYLWEISARTLKAADVVEVEAIIGPKPKLPTDIAKDVNEENMLMLQGKKVKTSPQDNVLQHLMGHLFFKESPQGLSMEPEKMQLLDEHIMATRQQLVQMVSQAASTVPSGMGMGGFDVGEGTDEGAPGVGGVEEASPATAGARVAPTGVEGNGASPQGGIPGSSSPFGMG